MDRSGWTRVTLGKCFVSSFSGASLICEDEPASPNEPGILKTSAIFDGRFFPEQNKRLKQPSSREPSTPVRRGSLIVCRSNSPELVGSVGYVYEDRPNLYLSDKLWELVPKPEMDGEFLTALISSPAVQMHVRAAANGSSSSMLNISKEDFSDIEVVLPALGEQQRISRILRTWDEAIGATELLVAKKLTRLSWFRSYLLSGLVRLDGEWRDWAAVRLAEVLSEHGQRSTGDESVYSVSVHKGLVNQIEHLGRSFAAASTAHYNRVLPGDVVYTKSPTGEFPLGIIKQSKVDEPVIVSPLYGVFTPETLELGFILDAYFQAPETARNYLAPLVQKGAKNTIAITNQRFLEGKLYLPRDPAEQRAIAEVLREALTEIDKLKGYAEALRRQKRGLMQKLLTGEWRTGSATSEEAAHA